MRRCLGDGCSALISEGSRCRKCRREQRAKYGGSWQAFAAAYIRQYVELNGWTCPGFERDPHESDDLVCDHVNNVDRSGGVRVMCRACNTRKRNAGVAY